MLGGAPCAEAGPVGRSGRPCCPLPPLVAAGPVGASRGGVWTLATEGMGAGRGAGACCAFETCGFGWLPGARGTYALVLRALIRSSTKEVVSIIVSDRCFHSNATLTIVQEVGQIFQAISSQILSRLIVRRDQRNDIIGKHFSVCIGAAHVSLHRIVSLGYAAHTLSRALAVTIA